MGLLKRIWAVLIGTCVGIILGILFDWLSQNGFVPPPEDGRMIVYPWIAGGGAFIGALTAALMIRLPGQGGSSAKQAPSRAIPKKTLQQPKTAQPARGGSEIKGGGLGSIKLEPVEGMPGFDLDDDDAGTAGSNKEHAGQ
jgi:hypothetical protein